MISHGQHHLAANMRSVRITGEFQNAQCSLAREALRELLAAYH